MHESPRIDPLVAQSFLALGVGVGTGRSGGGSLLADLSFVHYPWLARPASDSQIPLPKSWEFPVGLGVFGLAGSVRGDHARYAIGPQLNAGSLGVEVGASLDARAGTNATTLGAHLGLFVSAAVIGLAARWSVPLRAMSAGEAYPGEFGLWIIVKPGSFVALPMPR